MSLKARINDDMKAALRAKDTARLGAIRLLLAAMKQREVDDRIELTDAHVISIVEKMLKQRRDSIAAFEKGARQDLADKERFEADVLARRAPAIQLTVDATAMTQAGLGVVYLNQIFLKELLDFFHQQGIDDRLPALPVMHVLFNPNNQSAWFTSVMQIVTNVTVLAIILVGAAVIREREHGTIEHLLVMPVRPSEIAMAKILANGGVIVLAVALSLALVVHGWLGVPLAGSLGLFMAGTALYLFAVTALGILLATVASSMPQFGLLAAPVYVVLYLLSGAATPVESMPWWLQDVVQLSPTTQFVKLTQAVLYRGAGLSIVWPQLLAVAACGAAFLVMALSRFRSMLARQV